MHRETLCLESWRFTSIAEFCREVGALLEASDYKLDLAVRQTQMEHVSAELENYRTMGRIKLRVI